MPSDVAMQRPDTGVIGVVLNDQVSRLRNAIDDCGGLQHLDIASLGVLDVGDGAVPGANTLSEDVEVVPVEMHRVSGGDLVFHDDADGVVVAEVVDVPFGIVGVRDIAKVRQEQDWVIVVAAERHAVHFPKHIAGSISTNSDINGFGSSGLAGSWEGEEWSGALEWVVATVSVVKWFCD